MQEVKDRAEIRNVIKQNLMDLQARIGRSCSKVGRSTDEIILVAVTKTISIERIEAAIDVGITIIGENRVQEAIEKYRAIGDKVEWHLVGHLQTNKVKKAMEMFTLIQSIDSLYLAAEVEKRANAQGKEIQVLIEANTSGEDTKFGVKPGDLFRLIKDMMPFIHLNISGLMTIGPGLAIEDKEKSRPCFRTLYELRQNAEAEFGIKLPYLSMGMSSDFEVGIEEGSNMIRVGTAIFGERSKH
jgi:pyridoxal phosphate enzyme (YggS family)